MNVASARQERPAASPPRSAPVRSALRSIGRSLRPHHWLKNAIVAVPLAAAHRFTDQAAVVATLEAVVAFCAVASAGYVVNDLADRHADAAHPRKRLRPIASGELRRTACLAIVLLLLAAGGLVSALLPWTFSLLLAGYGVASLGYTFFFRRQPMLDVIVLGGLYTARVFAGGFATGIPVSEWLISFSMFLFVSLAFVKRAAELVEAPEATEGRGYLAADREIVLTLGASAGLTAVVVLTLYLASPEVRRLYAHPQRLWAACPLLLYWVAYLWLRVRRGTVRDDPIVFALSDRATWVVLLLGAAVVVAAS